MPDASAVSVSDTSRRGTLAIDLGSTTTVVAWQDHKQPPCLLPLPPYSLSDPCVVPSLIWQSGDAPEAALLGRQVLEAGLAGLDRPELCRDFKRCIGAAGTAAAGLSEASRLSPEAAGSLLLQRLWRALPGGIRPHRLVLTAPVDSWRGYRRWLLEAAAGLEVPELALVDEPTAAAIGAGLAPGSRLLVVDLGGGTIDLSLVQLEGGEGRAAPIAQLLRFGGRDLARSGQALRTARVIGKAGLRFGGRDIDRWIAAELAPGVQPDSALLQVAEQIKCRLSEAPEARSILARPAEPPQQLLLSRRRLEALLQERGLLAQLDQLLEEVLAAGRAAGVSLEAIDAVLPVGGASRMPCIHRWLQERCAPLPLRGERPVEAVALGALALTPGVNLRDVLAKGVSLRCWDQRRGRHHWQPLFVAGQPWPTETPLELVLACSREHQQAMELVLGEPQPEGRAEVVFEGGLPLLRARPAGAATVRPWTEQPAPLPLHPPGRPGEDRLRLRFRLDAGGALQLEGEDLASGAPVPARSLGPVR
ncbi:MAG: Hsp70 family protein [Synechococcaceae cyanobacterium]|nr:Hsp70 family protein [Synechococcaceae cyanobacterium]